MVVYNRYDKGEGESGLVVGYVLEVEPCGEEQTFLYPQDSSGWSNNQIDMRQISKRK